MCDTMLASRNVFTELLNCTQGLVPVTTIGYLLSVLIVTITTVWLFGLDTIVTSKLILANDIVKASL